MTTTRNINVSNTVTVVDTPQNQVPQKMWWQILGATYWRRGRLPAIEGGMLGTIASEESTTWEPSLADIALINEIVAFELIANYEPSGADTITLSETGTTILIPELVPSVSDAVFVGVGFTPELIATLLPAITDLVTVGESVTVMLQYLVPSVTDALTVGSSAALTVYLVNYPLSVQDAASVTDTVTPPHINVVNILVGDDINVSEATFQSLGEPLALAPPPISEETTLTDTVSLVFDALVPDVGDSVGVTEAVDIAGGILFPSVTDGITIADLFSGEVLIMVYLPSVDDTATLSETLQTMIVSKLRVADGVTLTETVTVVPLAIPGANSETTMTVPGTVPSEDLTLLEEVQLRLGVLP